MKNKKRNNPSRIQTKAIDNKKGKKYKQFLIEDK